MGDMETEEYPAGSRVVLWYRFRIDGTWQEVPLPDSARVVYVEDPIVARPPAAGKQYRSLYFWAETQVGVPVAPKVFRAFITGEPITDPTAEWVGSFREDGFRWHLYMKEA